MSGVADQQGGTELVTVLFTDLVGSTELFQSLGEDAAESFRRDHFALLRAAVAGHRGMEVKNIGDGLMVVFPSATDAISAAVGIQEAIRAANRSADTPAHQVRIGLQAGEPHQEGGDYFGTPVVVARRLCDAAGANQILAGDLVVGLAGSRGGFRFHPVGPLRLKGVADPVQAELVLWWPATEDGQWPLTVGSATARVTRPPALAPPPDAFVGREAELTMLTDLLGTARLVTITGPGGIGKTRLSSHLVDAVAPRYPDGVWCCALASVSADAEVVPAVASALRIEQRAGVLLEDRIVEFLAPKQALVVLDNCEQVLDGAGSLSEAILVGADRVDVLATSREALGLSGEHRVPLDPLRVQGRVEDLTPAMQLFCERAAATSPGFDLDEETRNWVSRICWQVDGLPLAIELAAARVGTRSLPEIAVEVSDRLDELSVRRAKADRHRSVHALVEWSYDLLSQDSQRIFEQLSVFAGGWRADAAAAVSRSRDAAHARDQLDTLVDQSLVATRREGAVTRYAMLEPIRAHAAHRLALRPDRDDVRDRHAEFFVTLAEQVDRELRGPEEMASVYRLTSEIDNLRAAHAWLLQQGNADQSLRLVSALAWVGFATAISEVCNWAEEAVERFADSGHPALSRALGAAACGGWQRGDLVQARRLAERGIEAAGGDPCLGLMSFQARAAADILSGDFDEALVSAGPSREGARAIGDDYHLIWALGTAVLSLAYSGRTDEACRVADEAMELAAQGNSTMRAWAYYCAGEARLETDPAQAAVLHERSVTEGRRVNHRFIIGVASLSAVSLQARAGDPFSALPRFAELIEHWQHHGAWSQQWVTIRSLIETLAAVGRSEPAAVLYGALGASPTATPVLGADLVRLAAVSDRLRGELGQDAFKRFEARGAGLGDAGALAYAVETLRAIPDGT